MFIAGDIIDFKNRLHQLPTTIADVDNFVTEGDSYSALVNFNTVNQWETEARLQKFRFTANPTYLTISLFGHSVALSPTSGYLMFDVNGFEPADINIMDPSGVQDFSSNLYTFGSAINCLNLTSLDCSDNALTSLNTSGSTALTYLDCSDNRLTSLDVSTNTALDTLYCNYNQYMASVNVSNTLITTLNLFNGMGLVTGLNTNNCASLASLNCDGNLLTSLNTSGLSGLTVLHCRYNQITSLDMSESPLLTELYGGYNQLASLEISSNTLLALLDLPYNNLTLLDISPNTGLINLSCEFNHLPQATIDKILLDLVSNNQISGYLNISNNEAPSVTGYGDIAVLTGRSWSVISESPLRGAQGEILLDAAGNIILETI
jgi:hypothetical protein